MKLFGKISFKKKKPFSPKDQIIHTISELTLDKFIVCICDGNLTVLVKDWFNITKDEAFNDINQAWENIYTEYVEAMKDKEQKYLLRLTKEINLLQCKLVMIDTIIRTIAIEFQLSHTCDHKQINALRKYINVSGKFDPEDAVSYARDLEMVIANSKRLLIEYQTKKLEYEKLVPVNSKTKVDKKYFDDILTQLSKHMKSIIDPKNTTVGFFVSMMNDMRNEIDRIEKELRKVKNH